ncbi:hypothetical protein A6P54_02585 [Bacillus sp. MKU004]|nr:hypothetical protein A6P54_02585 [Bacillus sp. MKU004]
MIYITGDTHGYTDISKLNSKRFKQNKYLTKKDFVIILGDFGLVWDDGNDENYWRKWINKKNFTTLFIDGNHENFNLLETFPEFEWKGGTVRKISNSIFQLMRGQIYNIDGYKVFTFGGALSIDKDYRTEGKSWWEHETPNLKEYNSGLLNLEKNNWEVDYILTHTAPFEMIYKLNPEDISSYLKDDMCKYLSEIMPRINYRHWYFGHFHVDYKIDEKHTVVFNKILQIK